MADIDWDDVTGLASDLSAVSAAAQTDILAYVNGSLNPDAFGGEESTRYRLARIFLAAHYGTLEKRKGQPTAGPVTSETAGGLSRSYSNPVEQHQGAALFSTGWGREYDSLVKRSPAARAPLVT